MIQLYKTLFNYWMRFPQKLRFLLVGGYNTVFSYLLYALFLWLNHEQNPQIILFATYLISSINSFLTQKFYVFNTKGNYINEYLKCVVSWSINYGINIILLYLFTHIVMFNPYIAQALALGLITILSYLLLKYFAFKSKKL